MDYEEFAQQYSQMTPQQQTLTIIFGVAFVILMIIGQWKLFQKAGEKGWKSIVPFLNVYTQVKIVDGNGWKFLLFIIPIVSFIYGIILSFREAKAFGKGTGFGFGLLFFPYIFTLILGFGSAQYIGPQGKKKQ